MTGLCEEGAQRGGSVPGFTVDHAAEVGLVGVSDISGESGEVGFAVCESFKGEGVRRRIRWRETV